MQRGERRGVGEGDEGGCVADCTQVALLKKRKKCAFKSGVHGPCLFMSGIDVRIIHSPLCA